MKVKITVVDKVTYTSDVIIELPSYMSEEEFEAHLDDTENNLSPGSNFEDVVDELERMGFEIKETETGFPDNPDEVNSEITNYEILEDDA